jgi:hypothetical protein
MPLNAFIEKIQHGEAISFGDTISVITEHYHYCPVKFTNGTLVNEAGTNEGSCKIFAFAKLHQLTEPQTLNLFGDYYREDVLKNPEGSNHQNIRNFMREGWAGMQFDENPLT